MTQAQDSDIRQEQLQIYATELAELYALVRSRSGEWLEAEGRLRMKATNLEAILQAVSSAHMLAGLMLEKELSVEDRNSVVGQLLSLLDLVVEILREWKNENGANGHDDLGLAALLRQEIYRMSAKQSWDVQVEMEPVRVCAKSEAAAYLIVSEVLVRVIPNHPVPKVALTLNARDERLFIKLIMYRDGTTAEESPWDTTSEMLLTRTYARFAGGSCRWRTAPDPEGRYGGVVEMELTLPIGTSDSVDSLG